MAVRIGINPLTWSNDDMRDLGAEIPLEVCLSEAAEAGYAGVELGHKFPRRAEQLAPLLERHGLALISGWYSAGVLQRTAQEELAAVESHLTLLAQMGCGVMVFAEGTGSVQGQRTTPLSRRPRLPAEDWPSFGERLTVVAEALQKRGIAMAYHHHMGTVVETEEEIDRLMENTGEAVGLLLDTGHLTYAGGNVAAVAQRHGGRINHIHCKDVRPAPLESALQRDSSFLNAVLAGVFTVPGDGVVDYPALLNVLKATGYRGWLVVEAEQDPAKAHPLTYARMGFENLSRRVGEAGLGGSYRGGCMVTANRS